MVVGLHLEAGHIYLFCLRVTVLYSHSTKRGLAEKSNMTIEADKGSATQQLGDIRHGTAKGNVPATSANCDLSSRDEGWVDDGRLLLQQM